MTEEISLTLEKLDGQKAVLRHAVLGEFLLPAEYVPKGVVEGETITLKILSSKQTEDEKYAHMRRLLEELIN